MKGPRKMPRLPEKAKKLKALAWVLGVLFSVIIARIVLTQILSAMTPQLTTFFAYTKVPANTPATHRNTIICHIVFDKPNSDVATDSPAKENTRTGFLPNRSAARPQRIISNI